MYKKDRFVIFYMHHIFINRTEIYDKYFANGLHCLPKEITNKQLTQWAHDVVSNVTSKSGRNVVDLPIRRRVVDILSNYCFTESTSIFCCQIFGRLDLRCCDERCRRFIDVRNRRGFDVHIVSLNFPSLKSTLFRGRLSTFYRR